jgi:hypothetical protein
MYLVNRWGKAAVSSLVFIICSPFWSFDAVDETAYLKNCHSQVKISKVSILNKVQNYTLCALHKNRF